MGVDWHPCASKQAQIVRIALCEQGSGEARRRCEIAAGVRGRGGVRGRFAPERLTKVEVLPQHLEAGGTSKLDLELDLGHLPLFR